MQPSVSAARHDSLNRLTVPLLSIFQFCLLMLSRSRISQGLRQASFQIIMRLPTGDQWEMRPPLRTQICNYPVNHSFCNISRKLVEIMFNNLVCMVRHSLLVQLLPVSAVSPPQNHFITHTECRYLLYLDHCVQSVCMCVCVHMRKILDTDCNRDKNPFDCHYFCFTDNFQRILSESAPSPLYGPLIDSLLLAGSHIRPTVRVADGKRREVHCCFSRSWWDSGSGIISSHARLRTRSAVLVERTFSDTVQYCVTHRTAYWICFNLHCLVFVLFHRQLAVEAILLCWHRPTHCLLSRGKSSFVKINHTALQMGRRAGGRDTSQDIL